MRTLLPFLLIFFALACAQADEPKKKDVPSGKAIDGLQLSLSADNTEVMLYAFKSDTLSHVWKLWAIKVANFALCFPGKSAMQPSIASWNFLKS